MTRTALTVGLLLLLAAWPGLAPSQATGGAYTLRKSVLAGGGADRASGGAFRLTATVAQPIAHEQSAGSLRLTAGFHAPRASAPAGDAVFANGFE